MLSLYCDIFVMIFSRCILYQIFSYHCASGYTNLMNHLKSNDHKDEWEANYDSMLKDVSTKSTLDRYRMEGASADARKYHGWMDGLDCFKNLPFDCVDDFHYQKYSNLGTASSKTIKKYMKAIQQIVKTKISENQSPFSIWSYF